MNQFLYELAYHVYQPDYKREIVNDFLNLVNEYACCRKIYEQYMDQDSPYLEPEAKFCCLVVFSVISCLDTSNLKEKVVSILANYDVKNEQKMAFDFIINGTNPSFKDTKKHMVENISSGLIDDIIQHPEIIKKYVNAFHSILLKNGIYADAYKNIELRILKEKDFSHDSISNLDDLMMCVYSYFFKEILKKERSNIKMELDIQLQQMMYENEKKYNECKDEVTVLKKKEKSLDKEIVKTSRFQKEELNSFQNRLAKEYKATLSNLRREREETERKKIQAEFDALEIQKLREAMYKIEMDSFDDLVFEDGCIAIVGDFGNYKSTPSRIYISNKTTSLPKDLKKVDHVYYVYQNIEKEIYQKVMKEVQKYRIPFDYVMK